MLNIVEENKMNKTTLSEILDFQTIEDFLLIKKNYKQDQLVSFCCKGCKEKVAKSLQFKANKAVEKTILLCVNVTRLQGRIK